MDRLKTRKELRSDTRLARIVMLRRSGLLLREIAAQEGFTPPRAKELVDKAERRKRHMLGQASIQIARVHEWMVAGHEFPDPG